jgi:molybdopterin converting factor small subunit
MSPEVTVRFTGELRGLAGHGSLQLSLEEGATLRDALVEIGKVTSPLFENRVVKLLLEGNQGSPLLLVNRTLCSEPEMDLRMDNGDIIAFVLPMEGG